MQDSSKCLHYIITLVPFYQLSPPLTECVISIQEIYDRQKTKEKKKLAGLQPETDDGQGIQILTS